MSDGAVGSERRVADERAYWDRVHEVEAELCEQEGHTEASISAKAHEIVDAERPVGSERPPTEGDTPLCNCASRRILEGTRHALNCPYGLRKLAEWEQEQAEKRTPPVEGMTVEEALAEAQSTARYWRDRAHQRAGEPPTPDGVERLREALRRCREAHARPAALKPLIEMTRVQQEDPDGCGVAVLAMLTGQSYADVDAEWPLRLTEHWKDSDVKPHMMMDYLWKRGYSLLVIRDRRYADGAWPSIRPFAPMHYAQVDSPTQPTGHWIAIDGEGGVLDPFDATRKTLGAYKRMHEIVGVWPARAALDAARQPNRKADDGR